MLESTTTAKGWARDLSDKLSIRFKSVSGLNTVRQVLDANDWPMLFCSHNGNEAAGQPVIAIRIMGVNVGAQDIFGNATIPFAPHVAQIACEQDVNGKPTPANSDIMSVCYEVSKLGTKIADLEIAHNTAVSEASMNAASPAVTLDSLQFPGKGA